MIHSPPRIFANPDVMPHGWYWALPSKDLAIGEKREIKIFGETLLLYRGQSGQVHCVEAFCPHMGAHLKEGRVEGDALRCGFHGWKFTGQGACAEIPCSSVGRKPESIRKGKSFLAAEKFSMIWLHSDPQAQIESSPLPSFPDLEGQELTCMTDVIEIRNCHPTLILGGGVDEEHFLFVHAGTTAMSGPLEFKHQEISPSVIRFENTAPIRGERIKSRIMSKLYGGSLKYAVTYWHASTALAELGAPFLPLYSIFAYRPTENGKTVGLNIYVTPKRRGALGWLISRLAIKMTRAILRKGGGEDKVIQNSIRFRTSPYTFDNPPFRTFVEYVERQPILELRRKNQVLSVSLAVSKEVPEGVEV